ncbi:MAG TPA: 2Fe-2S iron-sulfur cluster-binding protein [Cerasibacillus sp.]|uniref:2Fe-2S iron-sulfur cluster-binding protein n=1 Tax=Cerasibacillus sp. TaxID=2498711 RepID=UPI002F423D8A
MAKVIFHDADENIKEVTIREGHTILRAAKQGRIPLRHKCGGRASCTTCKVIIHEQNSISHPGHNEVQRLGEEQIEKGMRLSCQTRVYQTVEVYIPEDPFRARVRALLAKQRELENGG